MRPDRLVVGEFRGPEFSELLAALNTGHDGGAATLHANAAADVPARFLALGALAGLAPSSVVTQVASAFQVVIQLGRSSEMGAGSWLRSRWWMEPGFRPCGRRVALVLDMVRWPECSPRARSMSPAVRAMTFVALALALLLWPRTDPEAARIVALRADQRLAPLPGPVRGPGGDCACRLCRAVGWRSVLRGSCSSWSRRPGGVAAAVEFAVASVCRDVRCPDGDPAT